MLLDAWAAYFEHARKSGNGELIEDDDFDLDAILADLAENAGAQGQWEEIENWTAPDS